MKGAKRLAVSDSATDTNDSAFRNKRIMAGFPFGDHRAEPSPQRSSVTPTLDMQRAESSRQHVRALNAQFASWVQTQLKNHPDELWEDGVRDYLAHASDIMEKFSDVVSWLKANAQKGGNLSASESHLPEQKLVHGTKSNEVKLSQEKTFTPSPMTSSFASSWSFAEKKLVPEIRNNEIKLSQEKIFTPTVTSSFATNVTPTTVTSSFATNVTPITVTSSFANPWASGVFNSSQPSVFFGNQSSIPTNHNSSNDVNDAEDELPQPSSPSVKKSEEKGIVVVHEVKCKLYLKSSDPADKDTWKDKGTGKLSIKCKEGVSKGTKESKPTILVRNDVGKVLLNALLYQGIKTNLQKNSLVAIFHTSADGAGEIGSVVARTFLIRTKTEEDRDKLATAIQEYAPAS
ncbi:hypothetical protein Dsin_004566 [Dipteronia sinensis]|uniref:RanBD1 domain-containing protein n=1 Tax=Dipteronia sinensis TaxID=43782 RepID=A0AAE0AWA5_9ROSI|nr:hypothetical protein Dsin_004566 [Dipteronia sinensis]